MTITFPERFRLTAEDLWDIGSPEGWRIELLEGQLFVSPPPTGYHQFVADRVGEAIKRQGPAEWLAVSAMGVRLSAASLLIPDVVVVRRVGLNVRTLTVAAAEQVPLVVEIASPGSVRRDYGAKRQAYAAAGIVYLLVDPRNQAITAHWPDGTHADLSDTDWTLRVDVTGQRYNISLEGVFGDEG